MAAMAVEVDSLMAYLRFEKLPGRLLRQILSQHTTNQPKLQGPSPLISLQSCMEMKRTTPDHVECHLVAPNSYTRGDGRSWQVMGEGKNELEAISEACLRGLVLLLLRNPDGVRLLGQDWKHGNVSNIRDCARRCAATLAQPHSTACHSVCKTVCPNLCSTVCPPCPAVLNYLNGGNNLVGFAFPQGLGVATQGLATGSNPPQHPSTSSNSPRQFPGPVVVAHHGGSNYQPPSPSEDRHANIAAVIKDIIQANDGGGHIGVNPSKMKKGRHFGPMLEQLLQKGQLRLWLAAQPLIYHVQDTPDSKCFEFGWANGAWY
jgi:hypothetical protein